LGERSRKRSLVAVLALYEDGVAEGKGREGENGGFALALEVGLELTLEACVSAEEVVVALFHRSSHRLIAAGGQTVLGGLGVIGEAMGAGLAEYGELAGTGS
jgi:hypothetical protein